MPTDYGLAELAVLADVSVRTIRFYLAQGLLPAPGREGPSTRYPESTLHRLQLIRKLQRGHLPLAEIRNRIAGLSDADVQALLAEPSRPPAGNALDYVRSVLAGGPSRLASTPHPAMRPRASMSAASLFRLDEIRPIAPSLAASAPPIGAAHPAAPAAPTTPPQPERSQWERIELEPDIELHVRRPLSRIANRRVDRLIAFAQQLRKEDEK